MHVLSKIEILPSETLEEIILCAIQSSFLGPPAPLASVLRVSKTLLKKLGRDYNPSLYARIFSVKFDVDSATRRLCHEEAPALDFGSELVRRCDGMARLRRNSYPRDRDGNEPDGGMRVDLWTAYLMFLENEGKNSLQLTKYARVDRLALEFVLPGGMLHDGALRNEGWTVDSEVNALVLWLFWFTDSDRIKHEDVTESEEILGALGYLYTASLKYASTHGPLTHFRITPADISPTTETTDQSVFSLAASPFSLSCTIPNYFGREMTLARPLSTPPALLSSVARLGFGGGVPTGGRTPATRAEALQIGWTGATCKDYKNFRRLGSLDIELVEDAGRKHEHDWFRLLACHQFSRPTLGFEAFTPGMLDGIWDGRWLGIPPNFFDSLLEKARDHKQVEPSLHAPVFQQPMQFQIREHHQRDASRVLPVVDASTNWDEAGAMRAWLPDGMTTSEYKGQLHISYPNAKVSYTYSTYTPMEATLDKELPVDSERVRDIILTAETLEEFGDAWGHDRYVGRVREWDGLIVLVRTSREGVGRWVFRGYTHGGRWIGRWRETGTPVDLPGWEGVWSMTKRST